MDEINVKVVEAGGVFESFNIPSNSTVSDALRAAGARTDVQKQIKVNETEGTIDQVLSNGDVIYVVPNVKGNA